MRTFIGMTAVAFTLYSGVTLAQTAVDTTTTQTTAPAYVPPVVAAPAVPGAVSSTRTTRSVDAYGNQTSSKSTSYRDSQGVAEDQTTTRTTVAAPPPPPPMTTTTTTTETTSTGPQ